MDTIPKESIEKKIIFPTRNDPRWLILIFLFSFVIFAINSPGFSRSVNQYFASLFTCLTLEIALSFFYKRKLIFPLSGIITSLGILLLCDSPTIWVYSVVGAISILSKYFIRQNNSHIFNPNNFGLVCGLLFLKDYLTVSPGRWGGELGLMVLITILGILLVKRANRLLLASSFILTFLLGVLVRSTVTNLPFYILIGPFSGAAFHLYTFYMITDPKTSPTNKSGQISFGILLGVIDCLLRYFQQRNAPYYSLFILCGLWPLLKNTKLLLRTTILKWQN